MQFNNAFLNKYKPVSKLLIAQLGEDTFEQAMSKGYQAGLEWINVHPEITPEDIIKFFGGTIKAGFFYNLIVYNVLSLDKLIKLIPYTEMSESTLLSFISMTIFRNISMVDALIKSHSQLFTYRVQETFLSNAISYNDMPVTIYFLEKFNPSVCGEVLKNSPHFIAKSGNQLIEKLPEDIFFKLSEYVPLLKLLYTQQKTDIKSLSWKELLFGETGYAGIKKVATSFGEFRDTLERLFTKYSSLFPHNFELLKSCMLNMQLEDAKIAIDMLYYLFNDIPNNDWNTFFEEHSKILIKHYTNIDITKRAYSFIAWANAVEIMYYSSDFSFSYKIEFFSSLINRTLVPLPEVLYKIRALIKKLLISDENISDKITSNFLEDLYEYKAILGQESVIDIFNRIFDKNSPEINSQLIQNNRFTYLWDRLTDVIPKEDITPEFKFKFFKCAMDAYDEFGTLAGVEDLYEISTNSELIGPALELINKIRKHSTSAIFFTRKDYTPEECKELFVNSWKQSSRTPVANAVQLIMTEMEQFKGERASNIYFNTRTPKHFNSKILSEFIPPESRKNIQQFLSAVYSRTQASLMTDIKNDPDIEYNAEKNLLHLYRGVEEIYNVSAPMESWTSKRSVADSFDGADILEVWVPMEAVYVSWLSPDWETAKGVESAGLKESEYILITSKISGVKREKSIDFKEALKKSEGKIDNWLSYWFSENVPQIGDIGYFITEASLPKLYEAISNDLVPLLLIDFPSVFDITQEDRKLAFQSYRNLISRMLFALLNPDKITPRIRGAYSMTIDKITRELMSRLFGEEV